MSLLSPTEIWPTVSVSLTVTLYGVAVSVDVIFDAKFTVTFTPLRYHKMTGFGSPSPIQLSSITGPTFVWKESNSPTTDVSFPTAVRSVAGTSKNNKDIQITHIKISVHLTSKPFQIAGTQCCFEIELLKIRNLKKNQFGSTELSWKFYRSCRGVTNLHKAVL